MKEDDADGKTLLHKSLLTKAPYPPLTRSPFSYRRRRGGLCCLCALRFFSFARAFLQAILFYGGRPYSDCAFHTKTSGCCPILVGFFQLVAVGFHIHIRGSSPPIIKQKPQKINRRFCRPPFLLRTTAPLHAFSRRRRCQPKG